jgi:hypothetical protein
MGEEEEEKREEQRHCHDDDRGADSQKQGVHTTDGVTAFEKR